MNAIMQTQGSSYAAPPASAREPEISRYLSEVVQAANMLHEAMGSLESRLSSVTFTPPPSAEMKSAIASLTAVPQTGMGTTLHGVRQDLESFYNRMVDLEARIAV